MDATWHGETTGARRQKGVSEKGALGPGELARSVVRLSPLGRTFRFH